LKNGKMFNHVSSKFITLVIFLLLALVFLPGFTEVESTEDISPDLEGAEIESRETEHREDIVKFGGEDVLVMSHQVIEKDVISFGGDIVVDGIVGGNVIAFGGDININGIVYGDSITFGGTTIISPQGSLQGSEISMDSDGVVGGLASLGTHVPGLMIFGGIFSLLFRIMSFLGLLVVAVLLVYLAEDYVTKMSGYLVKNPGRTMLIGLGSLLVFPVLLLLVGFTLIGIPLIPFLIIAFIALIFYGYVSLSVLIGGYILDALKISQVSAVEMIVGYIALWLVRQVPFVGSLITLVIAITCLGLVLDTKFGTMRPWLKKG